MQEKLEGLYSYSLEAEDSGFRAEMRLEQLSEHVELIHVRIYNDRAAVPPVFRLKWALPVVDVCAMWHPASHMNRSLRADWSYPFESKSTWSAPVLTLLGYSGQNRLTFAFSDVLNVIKFDAGVSEETSTFRCHITMFDTPTTPVSEYEATLRIDKRDIPYFDSLMDVSRWWSSYPEYKPAYVPDVAKAPMYSTWYSFHQHVNPEEVEEQCRIAKSLGCDAVIMDDGWQTADNARGYAYCGAWQPDPGKMPDMRAHVERVHAMGMKYLLWYTVPFVGKHSEVWPLFQDKLLYRNEWLGAGVLDPRYPEVRNYLIETYERALKDWDLDGFKLDFVDEFRQPEQENPDNAPGRDDISVAQAVDLLLSDVIRRLAAIKPDIMIEFRQNYISPLMRKYGNMFRAADCPNDAMQNRFRTLDIRLLCDGTAAHADMMMWNAEETPEGAALQLINVLFAVPQVSVKLNTLPESHARMLAFWLSFWNEHRDTLLSGKLEPHHPELYYPLVIARGERELIAAAYSDTVVRLDGTLPDTVLIINGTSSKRLVTEWEHSAGNRNVQIMNCAGKLVDEFVLGVNEGVHVLPIPPSGVAVLNTVSSYS